MTKTTAKKFQCIHVGCDKSYTRRNTMIDHYNAKHSEKPQHFCEPCNKGFMSKRDKRVHDDLVHCESFGVSCVECHLQLKCSKTLQCHYREQHRNIKLKKCQCGQEFKRQQHLIEHMKTHTGDKPFECKEQGCNARFAHETSLTYHMRVHRNEKPFPCSQCSQRFRERSAVVKHIRQVHNKQRLYECEDSSCSETFKRKEHADHHYDSIHNINAQRYPCHLCNYSSTRRGHLKRHLQTTHDTGNNICDSCQEPHYSSIPHPDSTIPYRVCKDCYQLITGQAYRIELVVRNFLDSHQHIKDFLLAHDTQMKTLGGCSFRRPDSLYINHERKVIIDFEVDEHQHNRSADYTCEEARLTEIYDEFEHYRDYHMIVIRFNPDGYEPIRDDEKELPLEERLEKLEEIMTNFLHADHGLEDHEKIFVFYMFYDEDNDLLVQELPMFLYQ